MFRSFLMRGTLGEVADVTSQPFADALGREFSMTLNGFGTELGLPVMAAVLAGSVVLFAALALLAARLRSRPARADKKAKKEGKTQ